MSNWFWTIIFLSLAFSNYSLEAHTNHRKLRRSAAAAVVGTVYCKSCFPQDYPKANYFIAGASVAVECKDRSARPSFLQIVKTDNNGQFKVHLPFSITKHVKKLRGCSVKLISSNNPHCAVAATATSSTLHIKSVEGRTHIFSAGFFTFKPSRHPKVCDHTPRIKNLKNRLPNPNNQLSGVPLLPPLSNKGETTIKASQLGGMTVHQPMVFPFPPSIFPPNPLQPPPSILPPVIPSPPPSILPPLIPSPPPSIFPPLFPSPPPSIFPPIIPSPPPAPPFFHLPPIPGLTPSPPPPPPPSLLPPFPFPPIPGFPGVPPARVSSPSKTSFP